MDRELTISINDEDLYTISSETGTLRRIEDNMLVGGVWRRGMHWRGWVQYDPRAFAREQFPSKYEAIVSVVMQFEENEAGRHHAH